MDTEDSLKAWSIMVNLSTIEPYNSTDFQFRFEAEITEITHFLQVARTLRNVCLPIIVMVGLIGNTLTTAVFVSGHVRQPAPTAFLAMLAIVDNVFLVALFSTWFDTEAVNFLTTDSICQVLIYATYITSFLSVWYVVGFTFERYVNIVYPLRAPIFCSQFKEKTAVASLAGFAICIYTFAFWTTKVTNIDGKYHCGYDKQYFDLQNKIAWFDMIITMPVPFLLILCLNIRVVCTVTFNRSKANGPTKERAKTTTLRKRTQMKVTRTLLLVSTTFLILNLPSHGFRFYALIVQHSSAFHEIRPYHLLIQEVTQLLYYTTFSVNFFLYTLYGKQFKLSLCIMLKRWRARLCRRQKQKRRFSRGSFVLYTETSIDAI